MESRYLHYIRTSMTLSMHIHVVPRFVLYQWRSQPRIEAAASMRGGMSTHLHVVHDCVCTTTRAHGRSDAPSTPAPIDLVNFTISMPAPLTRSYNAAISAHRCYTQVHIFYVITE